MRRNFQDSFKERKQNALSKMYYYFRSWFYTLLQFSKATKEVKIEGTRRQGRRRKQLRDNRKGKKKY
jgi:hypothetical protein